MDKINEERERERDRGDGEAQLKSENSVPEDTAVASVEALKLMQMTN